MISWKSQFTGGAKLSPLDTGNVPFWWDILVVFGFSMIVHFWAQAARLQRQKMMDPVVRQSGEQEPA